MLSIFGESDRNFLYYICNFSVSQLFLNTLFYTHTSKTNCNTLLGAYHLASIYYQRKANLVPSLPILTCSTFVQCFSPVTFLQTLLHFEPHRNPIRRKAGIILSIQQMKQLRQREGQEMFLCSYSQLEITLGPKGFLAWAHCSSHHIWLFQHNNSENPSIMGSPGVSFSFLSLCHHLQLTSPRSMRSRGP